MSVNKKGIFCADYSRNKWEEARNVKHNACIIGKKYLLVEACLPNHYTISCSLEGTKEVIVVINDKEL